MQRREILRGGLAFAACAPMLMRAAPAAAGRAPAFAADLKPLLMADLRATRTPGALVYVDDPELGRWVAALGSRNLAGARLASDSHMRIGSVTKTLTGTAVLLLVDRGRVKLDAAVERYLPGMVPNGGGITVRQLLSMTSGLFNTTEDCRLNLLTDRNPYRSFTVPETLAFAFAHEPYFAPGAGFHYANTNYDILGELVERVTGRTLPAVIRQGILAPLALADTELPPLRVVQRLASPHSRGFQFGSNTQLNDAYLALLGGDLGAEVRLPRGTAPNDATFWNLSYTWASGAATSTLRDMAAWARALAEGTLLSPKLQRQRLTLVPGTNYGLGIAEVVPGFFGHSGAVSGFQSSVSHDPARRATIVVLANSIVAPNTPLLQALPADRMAATIHRTLYPAPPAAASQATPAAAAAVAPAKACR